MVRMGVPSSWNCLTLCWEVPPFFVLDLSAVWTMTVVHTQKLGASALVAVPKHLKRASSLTGTHPRYTRRLRVLHKLWYNERMLEFVARLPVMERDILHLHVDLHRTQADTARILGMSQPAVHSRYKRAQERLAVWKLLPAVTPHEVRAVLEGHGAREDDILAMALYVETNNQSEVARRMGRNQSWVHTALTRCLDRHLRQDMSHEDRHVRVRQACSLLVTKPGMFVEFNNPTIGHVTNGRECVRKFLAGPRVKPRLGSGITVEIQEGLYRGLTGLVETVTPVVSVKLDLLSQVIRLQWPTPSE